MPGDHIYHHFRLLGHEVCRFRAESSSIEKPQTIGRLHVEILLQRTENQTH